jgi:ketosteroid isomerase-like protein
MTATERLAAADETAIRQVIDDQVAAIGPKNLDVIVEPYRDDAVLFDVNSIRLRARRC